MFQLIILTGERSVTVEGILLLWPVAQARHAA